MAWRIAKWVVIGVATVFTLLVALIAFNYFFPPTYEAHTDLPGTNSKVAVQLQPMHLYLAEYRRALVLRKPGAREERMDMFPDTGGYSRTQLYRVSEGQFLIKGFFDEFLIDVRDHRITKTNAMPTEKTEYLGAFDDTGDGRWRFISASEDPRQRLEIEK